MENYNKISVTAKVVAHWKSKSDIPYAAEIADLIGAEQAADQLEGKANSRQSSFMIPVMEARYKSINFALKKSGLNHVMELASGLSPRGLQIVADNGTYLGTDLEEIPKETFPIIREIAKREGISEDHLCLQPVNALNREQLKSAADYFKEQPFAICNEGLMMYLDNSERAKMAQNIREVILQNEGRWITTDLAFHETMFEVIDPNMLDDEVIKKIKKRFKKISNETGRNFRDNWFNNSSEAVQFYKDIGFKIHDFPMYDGNYELSTLSLIQDEAKKGFLEALSAMKVWVLEAEE
jgi:O-methyltransferase involved in polyketide biosynthesis